MADYFEVSAFFPNVSAKQLFMSWLDSEDHSAFTGSPAKIDGGINGQFTAWDGYISGRTLELEPHQRIVQSWRTTQFPNDSPDSRLEVTLHEADDGTFITLHHTNIPTGQGEDYRTGWEEYYFKPMRAFFSA